MTTWNALLVLLRARLIITRNTFWRQTLWQKIVITIIVIGACGLAYILYTVSATLVWALRSPEFAQFLREAASLNPSLPPDPALIVEAVPTGLLFLAFMMLTFSGFSSVLSALYLAGDMDMLLTHPIPMRAVFIAKFFGSVVPQYVLLTVLLLPFLLGYGAGTGYGVLYVVATIALLLLLPLLPTAIGAILVMVVVRVIPARRAREIVSILGGLIAVGFYIFGQLAPEVAPHLASVNNVRGLLTLQVPLLPSAWAGRALVAVGEGEWLTLVAYGGLFLVVSMLVFAGCVVLAEQLYYAGWSNIAVQGGRIRRRSDEPQRHNSVESDVSGRRNALSRRGRTGSPLNAQVAAIFIKDWRIFPRDMRNIQQMIFPIALAGIWLFRTLAFPQQPAGTVPQLPSEHGSGAFFPDPVFLTALSSTGIAFFLCLSISHVLAGPAISREGRSFWLLKLAPVSSLRILLGKLALAFLPYPFIGIPVLFLLFLVIRVPITLLLTNLGLLLLIGVGNTCLFLGLGATFPRLDWENPQQQTTFQAGCLSMLLTPSYVGLILLSVFGPSAIGEMLAAGPQTELLLTLLGWFTALCITALVSWGSLYSGVRRLESIEM